MSDPCEGGPSRTHRYWLAGAMAVLLIGGGLFTRWTVQRADRGLREVMLRQTRLVAQALNVERVQALSGDTTDLGNPNYQRLKEQLAAIKQNSDQCRFVYLIGRREDGQVFFLVDNEPPNSRDYSPPGQIYGEAPEAIHRVFDMDAASVIGPMTDRWGVWVSSLVPLHDRQTGNLIAVLAMDIDARAWRRTVLLAAAWPVGLMLAVLALLILSAVLARSRRKILRHQEAIRAKSEELERYFSQSLDLLCLASTDGRLLRLNPEWERTLGYSIAELENRAFLDFVHPDDLASTREAVSRLSDQETILNFENRYRHKDGSYRWIEWRSIPQGSLIYAAARDVTDRKRAEQALRESQERLELAMEAANDGLWDWDIAQDKVFFDSRYYTLSGYQPNEFPQRFEEWSKRVHPDDLGRCQEAIEAHLSGKTRVFDIEFRFLRKDGSWMWIRGRGKVVRRDASGAVLRMVGTHADITERKRAEEELEKERNFLRQVIDAIPGFVCVKTLAGTFALANKALSEAYGKPPGCLEGHTDAEFSPRPEETEAFLKDDRRVIEKREALIIPEEKITYADGSVHWLSTIKTPLIESDGSCDRLLAVAMDITARKRSEDAIDEKNQFIASLLRAMPVAVFYKDSNGRYLGCNDIFTEVMGVTSEQIRGKTVYELWPSELAEKYHSMDLEIMRNREHQVYEFQIRAKDGRIHPVIYAKDVFLNKDGEVAGLVGAFLDITDRKRAEEALRESEKRFHRMLRAVPDMISIHDSEMNILYSNWRGFAEVAEDKRIPGTKCHKTYRGFDTICPDCQAMTVLESREPFQKEARLPDGRWVDMRVIPFLDESRNVEMFMEWVRDVTAEKTAEEDKRRLEENYRQAQKMESVGRLAGGVAHDFNNMLSVILGHTELALEEMEPGQPLYSDLQEIRKAAERSAALTRQLLAFARRQTVDPKVLDLNETVEGMLKMLRRLIGEDIELAWRPGEKLPAIKMDPSQIDQILANLCVNARDAINHSAGKVTIETGWVEFDQADCATRMDAAPGVYVLMAVSDNGSGMSEEIRAHVFEPFFTTKTLGEGTGLGLATVYGIVRQNRGFINVYSEEGRGTTLRIYLPACSEGLAEAAGEKPVEMSEGHETILLVEDEPAILVLATQMLERLGYRILAASSPEEALRLASEAPGEIHLLISDVVMPGMNGRDLAQRLLALHPGLKILFMSGYTANMIAHQGVLDKGVNFMQKPFSFQGLSVKVREALGR